MSERARLAWFAAVAFVAIVGIGNLLMWIQQSVEGPNWWGLDVVSIDAARRLAEGAALYADPKYLYPPLAAVVAYPLMPLDDWTASVVIAVSKVLVAVACVSWLTPSWRAGDRLLAVIGLVFSLPFLHDVFLGQTNVYLVGAMVPAVFGAPRARNGVLLGFVAAAFGKPLIIPVLLWLAVWRRPAFIGAAITGLAATACAIAVTGAGAYEEWVAAVPIGSMGRLSTPFAGNHGVTSIAPELAVPVALITALGLVLVLWRRGPRVALAWAVTSGILLAPYAGTYAALPIALALPAIGPLAPAFALAIVATSPIGTTLPLPFYAAAILVISLTLREPILHSRAVGSVGLSDPSG
jgi:hypothetical protein